MWDEAGLLRLTAGAQYAVVDPAAGGTVHRLALVPRGSTKTDACVPEPIIAGDDPISPSPSVRRDSPGAFRGRLLVPFNDRIVGARYQWENREHHLTVNEPETGDAIHGFLYRSPFTIGGDEQETPGAGAAGELKLRTQLPQAEGYPFRLGVEASYRLQSSWFELTLRICNHGDRPAPLAAGWHPYFVIPSAAATVDELILHVPTDRYVEVDTRLAPTGRVIPTAGTARDFSDPRRIGGAEIDDAFPAPRWPVTLSGGTRRVQVFAGGMFRMVQVFIPPDRRSVAVEPVTSPAEAFNLRDQGHAELGCLVVDPGTCVSGTIQVKYCFAPTEG